jgi:hypothetical protein
MTRDQFYAQLDMSKLIMNTTSDILTVPIGQSNYSKDVITAANRLQEGNIAFLSRVLSETEFEDILSEED